MATTRSKVFLNFIWRFAERCGAQLVTFVVSIVLARLLDPDTYGTIALVTVFTTVLNVFVDSGFGNALIQKKDADDLDFSSVFYFNIAVCCLLYVGMFFASPLIAKFYNDISLVPVIRVLSLTLIISGVKNVQQAYVSRTLQFKRFFFATLGGTLGAAAIGIVLAYRGFGVWALVAQQLFNAAVDTIILWITVKWKPKKMFSFSRLKNLFNYGWKLLASSIIETVYNNLYQLIVGKKYTESVLAFYNRGTTFPNYIVNNINTSIDSVLLPVMSAEQDDKNRVRDMTRRAIKTTMYILAPLMIGMAFVAPTLVKVLLTEKWLPCVFFLRVFSITYLFHPINTSNMNAIKSIGRSDLILKLEIIKKSVGLVALLTTVFISVKAMACSLLVVSILHQIINSWPNRKLLDYGYLQQLKDILPSLILATVMGACVYLIKFIGLGDFVTLAIQVVLGAVIYISGSYILKIDSFGYLISTVKSFLTKSKNK